MANAITCIRIICSIAMLFCPTLSIPFYSLYIVAGVSDMIDGAVARKTNSVSELDAKLDTVADFAFLTVCLIKLIPILNVEAWMYVWIMTIAVIKAVNVLSGYIIQKKFITAHSVMNKITGLLLFAMPISLSFIELQYSSVVLCVVATFAAVQEGYYVSTGRGLKNDYRIVEK